MKELGATVLAVFVMMPISCVGVYFATASQREKAVDGWHLQPVVVAAVDITEGHTLTMEDISQRSIPEQFLSEAYVKPMDAALVIGRKMNFAMQAGDPLTRNVVAPVDPSAGLAARCVEAIGPAVDAAGVAARDEALAQLSAPLGQLEPLALPGATKVVALTQDVPEGETLTAKHLKVVDVPAAFTSGAEVQAGELSAVEGAQVVMPLLKGDVVAWVHLSRKGGPETIAGCAFRVDAAVEKARADAARREAKAWKPAVEEAKP